MGSQKSQTRLSKFHFHFFTSHESKQPAAWETVPSPRRPPWLPRWQGFLPFLSAPFSPALASLSSFPLPGFLPVLFKPRASQLCPSSAYPSSSDSQHVRLFLGGHFTNQNLFITFLLRAPRTFLDINLGKCGFFSILSQQGQKFSEDSCSFGIFLH